MNLEQILDFLRNDRAINENISHWKSFPAKPAQYADFPDALDRRLVTGLQERGIKQLYTHQAEAVDAVQAGRDVVVVTPTASGKTLCYNLPVIDRILKEPDSRALYLFPTKALSQDQLSELYALIQKLEVDIKTYTFDGDTPQSARRLIRSAGHIVISNPDMLHCGILPHHTRWIKLFEKNTSSSTKCTTTGASSAAISPTSSNASNESVNSTAPIRSLSVARRQSPTRPN